MEHSKDAKSLRPGVYQHFKGMNYSVIGVAFHSETFEEVVIYRKMYEDCGFWVRPLKMFLEKVDVDGQKVLRFRFMCKDE